jgi:hypothetical protein
MLHRVIATFCTRLSPRGTPYQPIAAHVLLTALPSHRLQVGPGSYDAPAARDSAPRRRAKAAAPFLSGGARLEPGAAAGAADSPGPGAYSPAAPRRARPSAPPATAAAAVAAGLAGGGGAAVRPAGFAANAVRFGDGRGAAEQPG